MGNRYLIVSDLHICDIENHPDGWKAYKKEEYGIDRPFKALVKKFVTMERAEGPLTLILNGDIIDFDLVTDVPKNPLWKVTRKEHKRGLMPTEEKSVWKLKRVLEDHSVFLSTLAHYLAAGHKLIYLLGNHDREFHFPNVRQAFVDAIQTSAQNDGLRIPPDTVRFEPWFYYVAGELYVEHGNQYDYYSSYRYILSPVILQKGKAILALPMGNLSNRYLLSNMGFFNPHASDFILNIFTYVAHWLRYYAFSRRSLLFNWFFGSLSVMGSLLRSKKQLHKKPKEYDGLLAGLASRFELPMEKIHTLGNLHRLPITTKFYRIIREFWIDRVFIALLMTGGTIALALMPIPLWTKLMVPLSSFPLSYFIYEWIVRGETIFTAQREVLRCAVEVSRTLPVRLICFGHTHLPRLIPLAKEVTFVDTGTWAPISPTHMKGEVRPGYWNYVIASFEDGTWQVSYQSWMEKNIHE